MFFRSFSTGIALLAIIGIGHFAFTRLSDAIMQVHQRRMPPDELEQLKLCALSGRQLGSPPKVWSRIANTCGLAYVVLVASSLWYFFVK